MTDKKEEILTNAYRDYQQALFKHSYFKVSDKELAHDLVQATFLKTWNYLGKGGKIDSMKAFLFHVLNDLIVDQYRKKKALSFEVLTQAGFEVVVDDSERLLNEIDGKTAMHLIPQLSDKYRDVVSLRFVEEKSLKEIAEITHQSKNTVAVQIHRGLEKLAVLFRVESVQ